MTSIMPPPVRRDQAVFDVVARDGQAVGVGVGVAQVDVADLQVDAGLLERRAGLRDRASSTSQPSRPPKSPMSALADVGRWQRTVRVELHEHAGRRPAAQVARDPPVRTDAAECGLDGPRITGPTTSLKMLGGSLVGMTLLVVVDRAQLDAELLVVEATQRAKSPTISTFRSAVIFSSSSRHHSAALSVRRRSPADW